MRSAAASSKQTRWCPDVTKSEVFISVDVETAGPIPGKYSLLTLGACVIEASEQTFARSFKPITMDADPKALEVTGLSLEHLHEVGESPLQVMTDFAVWIEGQVGQSTPVFVGLNAAFDWAFVNYYFHMYLGRNPFGFAPLDIKSMFFGVHPDSWRDTRSSHMVEVLNPVQRGTHDALDDAKAQAELFVALRSSATKWKDFLFPR